MAELADNIREALEAERAGLEARLKSGAGDPEMLKRRIGEVGGELGDRPAGRKAAPKETR